MKPRIAPGANGVFLPDENTYVYYHNSIAYIKNVANTVQYVRDGRLIVDSISPYRIAYATKKNVITWFEEQSDSLIISTPRGYKKSGSPFSEYTVMDLGEGKLLFLNDRDELFYKNGNIIFKIKKIDGYYFFEAPPFTPVRTASIENVLGADFVIKPPATVLPLEAGLVGKDIFQCAVVKKGWAMDLLIGEENAYLSPVKLGETIALVRCENDEVEYCTEFPEVGDVLMQLEVPGLEEVTVMDARVSGYDVYYHGEKALIVSSEGKILVNWERGVFEVLREYGARAFT